jgi:hypothetical protein
MQHPMSEKDRFEGMHKGGGNPSAAMRGRHVLHTITVMIHSPINQKINFC